MRGSSGKFAKMDLPITCSAVLPLWSAMKRFHISTFRSRSSTKMPKPTRSITISLSTWRSSFMLMAAFRSEARKQRVERFVEMGDGVFGHQHHEVRAEAVILQREIHFEQKRRLPREHRGLEDLVEPGF